MTKYSRMDLGFCLHSASLHSYLFEVGISSVLPASPLPPYKIYSLVCADLRRLRCCWAVPARADRTAYCLGWGAGGRFRRGEAGVCGRRFLFCFTSTISRQSRPGVIAPGLRGLLWFWITAAVDVSSEPSETVRSHNRDGGQPPPPPTTVDQSLPIVFFPGKTWQPQMLGRNVQRR